MKCETTSLVLDTNVMIDYYLGDRPKSGEAKAFFDYALAHKESCPLLYSPHCISTLFYLISNATKQSARQRLTRITEKDSLIAIEFAWGCIDHLQENATAVGADQSDVWLACKLRGVHNDLEDNLIIAAATRAHASYLITNDEKLIKHATVPALTPKDALAVLRSFDEGKPAAPRVSRIETQKRSRASIGAGALIG